MKLTAISIKDFGCIAYRVVEIGPDGAEIKGPSGTGKTTIGDAIAMTLVGMGISKDAIPIAIRTDPIIDRDKFPAKWSAQKLPIDDALDLLKAATPAHVKPKRSLRKRVRALLASLRAGIIRDATPAEDACETCRDLHCTSDQAATCKLRLDAIARSQR